MSQGILVAGIGNIFLGDDGFGVEAARRLANESLPAGVEVVDFGIRGVHLAFRLLEPINLLIILDAVGRGEAPGTLYLIEPAFDGPAPVADAHGMDLASVFTSVRSMGGQLPPIRIVGCEPLSVGEGIGLSPQVESGIEPALVLVRKLLEEAAKEEDAAAPAWSHHSLQALESTDVREEHER